MKLTLEIPTGLMRKAEAVAASQAQSVEAVVVEALKCALVANGSVRSSAGAGGQTRRSHEAVKWLQQWEQLVNAVDRARQSGRTAREILRQTRR